MRRGFNRSSLLRGLLVVTMAVLVTTFILAVTVNAQCQNTFDNHTPIYPGAEITHEEYGFLGRKMMVLYAPEAADQVDAWYRQTHALAVAEDVKNRTQTAWRGLWTVEPASDRPGSTITLRVPCGQY